MEDTQNNEEFKPVHPSIPDAAQAAVIETALAERLRALTRISQCAPTARFTSGGRIHPGSCR